MQTILTPEETREHSIFTLPGREAAGAMRWLMLLLLAAIAWAGGVGYLGQFRPSQVSSMVAQVAPLSTVYWSSLAAAWAIAIAAVASRRWTLGWAAATIGAYLAGFAASGLLYAQLRPVFRVPFAGEGDALGFAVARLWFALPIVILSLAVWLAFRARTGAGDPALGLGNWFVRSRDVKASEPAASWFSKLFGGYLAFVVVFALLIQAPVGFEPVLSGAVWALLPSILIAAAANAAAEEAVYRGFIQPAFIRYGGAGAGLWVQGLFFGFIHWGLSVGVVAALPTSLLIGLGSVVWGKAAYETRGLAWTVTAHFMIDVAIMAAYFVRA